MASKKPLPPPDYAQAAHQLAHQFGVKQLAALMQMPESTLYNKVNPNDLNAHLTGPEILIATLLAKDTQILEAMCRTAHGAYYPLPQMAHVADEHLVEMFAAIGREESELQTAIVAALDDRKVRSDEMARIEREASELISAVLELVERVRAMVTDERI